MRKKAATPSLELLQGTDGFFREVVTETNRKRSQKVDHQSEAYLAELLSNVVKSSNFFGVDDKGNSIMGGQALYERLSQAMEEMGPQIRAFRFRHLGDFSLTVSGLFGNSLERKMVDIPYYIDMGSCAYRSAGELMSSEDRKALFENLSLNFQALVTLLMDISDEMGLKQNESLLRIYENWLNTGHEKSRQQLYESGIIPLSPENKAVKSDHRH